MKFLVQCRIYSNRNDKYQVLILLVKVFIRKVNKNFKTVVFSMNCYILFFVVVGIVVVVVIGFV